MENQDNQDQVIDFRDPDRNRCPEEYCNFEKINEENGVTYERCTRCGRKRNLNYRV